MHTYTYLVALTLQVLLVVVSRKPVEPFEAVRGIYIYIFIKHLGFWVRGLLNGTASGNDMETRTLHFMGLRV